MLSTAMLLKYQLTDIVQNQVIVLFYNHNKFFDFLNNFLETFFKFQRYMRCHSMLNYQSSSCIFFPLIFLHYPSRSMARLCKCPNLDLVSVELACTCNFSIFPFDYGINQRLFHPFPPRLTQTVLVFIQISFHYI